ncbi:MAG: glycosyltransferase [Candidatus Altiarchaeota archaeon]
MIDTILSALYVLLTGLHVSWLALFFYPSKRSVEHRNLNEGITILIPAHNEEKIIQKTIETVLSDDYPGKIEVMVLNDCSTDRTSDIVREIAKTDSRVVLYNMDGHVGKSNAVNFGLKKARNPIVIILDADSEIEKNGLSKITKPFADKMVGGVSCIMRARQTKNPLTWFQDMEYMLASGSRYLFNKVDGTYFLPGFAAFRKKALEKIGGFSKMTFSEDLDIGLRLKKAGYKLEMSNTAVYTQVPETIRGFIRQRIRWCVGTVQVIRKHSDLIFNKKYGVVGMYCIPIQIFWYLYSLIYIPIAFYQIFGGYIQNFAVYKNYLSLEVVRYFFNWFSAYGMVEYVYKTVNGVYPVTTAFYTLLVMFVLYMTYNLLIMTKFSKPSLRFFITLFFLFPYFFVTLALHIVSLIKGTITPTIAANKWEKAF